MGQTVCGFDIQAVVPLDELEAIAYRAEHRKSGARVFHLHTQDEENLFSIHFPTPPPDDTGLPHILEHAVLAGSKRFPVREPFFEMLKMSMATFLNAMTGCDCTHYPVASNVRQDLFNLAEVYVDAVFHPLLTEETFLREGHHLAPVDPARATGPLTIQGIVFNEMKGAFSDPETRIWRGIMRRLFPDTVYSRESGGDPDAIPSLSYEAFLRFHKTFYHPSNAYFYLYGDVPPTDYLAFLDERLAVFQRVPPLPSVRRQRRWRKHRSGRDTYPIGENETEREKTYLAVHWLVGDATDVQDHLRFQVLSQILFGNEAAPLRKALIDAKLGHDLFAFGSFPVGCELTFMVGIKGSESFREKEFVERVFQTLSWLADAPPDQELTEAAFQQVAYRCLEIQPLFPLHTMSRALQTWIYTGDPLPFLRLRHEFAVCREAFRRDPRLFHALIRDRLVQNPHRVHFVLQPDRGWQKRRDRVWARRLAAIRRGLSESERVALVERHRALEEHNGTPNPPEAVATLPQLKRSDLPAKPRHIPTSVQPVSGHSEWLINDVFSNGVNYLELSFDLAGLPAELWPALSSYCDALHKLGAAGMNYEQMARRQAACTGGLSCRPVLSGLADVPGTLIARLHVTVKALDHTLEPALDVLHDLLFGVDPRDPPRLRDVVTQARAAFRSELVQDGVQTALLHAARAFSLRGHLTEVLDGLPQLRYVERIYRAFEKEGPVLMDAIETIREFVVSRQGFVASFTGSANACSLVERRLNEWAKRLKGIPGGPFPPHEVPDTMPCEGLAGAIQVAHCVRMWPAPHFSHPDEPFLELATHLVHHEYLLNEIRLKGNAYGAGFRYDGISETFSAWSYNDPHIVRTLDVFARIPDYVRAACWSQDDVHRAILAIAKYDERPIRPGPATGTALLRHLTRLTPERREERYARLKEATPAAVKRSFLDALDAFFMRSAICVTASREKLEAANRELGSRSLRLEDILEDECTETVA